MEEVGAMGVGGVGGMGVGGTGKLWLSGVVLWVTIVYGTKT